jgi:hypothetical protein
MKTIWTALGKLPFALAAVALMVGAVELRPLDSAVQMCPMQCNPMDPSSVE